MDLKTILRALSFVGETSDAGMQLFEGFLAITSGADQAALKERYDAACAHVAKPHTVVRHEFDS